MFNVNKALLSILIIPALAVQTTRPTYLGWATDSSIYKACAPYGSWLINKAYEHKYAIAGSFAAGALILYAKKKFDDHQRIQRANDRLKKLLDTNNWKKNEENIKAKIMYADADVNTQSDQGITALYLAVQNNSFNSAERLYTEYHANPDIPTKNGDTARKAAQRAPDTRFWHLFRAYSLDPEVLKNSNSSLLEVLTNITPQTQPDWFTIRRYITYGADPNTATQEDPVEKVEIFKMTALHFAVMEQNIEMVRFLRKHGASSIQGNSKHKTPLCLAQELPDNNPNKQELLQLLENGI